MASQVMASFDLSILILCQIQLHLQLHLQLQLPLQLSLPLPLPLNSHSTPTQPQSTPYPPERARQVARAVTYLNTDAAPESLRDEIEHLRLQRKEFEVLTRHGACCDPIDTA